MKRCLSRTRLTCALSAVFLIPTAFGQHKVDPRNTHERLLCIVPLVGTGTGILAYHFEESDDHKSALVEFVAADRAAFNTILAVGV